MKQSISFYTRVKKKLTPAEHNLCGPIESAQQTFQDYSEAPAYWKNRHDLS